jgi:opacity protein-like surface antigen
MKTPIIALAVVVLAVSSASAQSQAPRGLVQGLGGVDRGTNLTTGSYEGTVGFEVARNIFITADFGRLQNVMPTTLQDNVNQTVAAASALDLSLTPVTTVPAWYGMGGVRVEAPVTRRLTPYVTGALGLARVSPTVAFDYMSGSGDGNLSQVPTAGADITSQVVSLGLFAPPTAERDAILGLGGGVSVGVARRVSVDLGYRYSRIFGNSPINVSGAVFGLGYHF